VAHRYFELATLALLSEDTGFTLQESKSFGQTIAA
jgi:hypothetical protein